VLVRDLIASHPLDEAMARAVGGSYDLIGGIERDALIHAGLRDGMAVVDLGGGSGRLAHALGQRMHIEYFGVDIIEELLRYARTKAPENYRFVLNRALTLPADDASADMACAFSVFTHLLHAETHLYLEDMRRVLRPGGRVVFSFLEFAEPDHWPVFEATVGGQRTSTAPHLNTFVERDAIGLWCRKLGYECEAFIDSGVAPWGGPSLGQSLAILRRP